MFETLRKILSKADSDYSDIRYEIKRETKIVFNGKELFHLGSSSTDGFVVRVLKNGGLSSVAFTRAGDAGESVRIAEENAALIARHIKNPVEFSKTDIIHDTFLPELEEDPRTIPIDEKLRLTRNYNSIPLKHERIATTHMGYSEIIREKYFLSTEGTEIREDLVTTSLGGLITSRDGTLTQNVRVGMGGSSGFALLRNREDEIEQRTAIALDLLQAKPVAGGIYNVVLNPDLAGVFTHEAFGHFSEADLIEDTPSMRERMQIGKAWE